MANLQDIIAKNKQRVKARDSSGTLTETSGEELQGLAQKAGLKAPPVTPLGASAIGANEHQAKMAGTPAQKQAAISMSSGVDSDLQTVLRRQQARDQATQQEQQTAQKSENLKQLGALGDRVHGFINVQRNKLQEQAQQENQALQIQASEDSSLVQGLAPEQAASFKQLLEQFQQDPTNMELLVQAGNLIGGRAIDPREVAGLYQTADQVITQQTAAQMADSFTVNDLFQDAEFGYTPDELSSLLGVTPEELQAFSVSDLENKVAELTQAEFAQAAQTQQQVGSSQLGAAERQFARGMSREQSAVGIRSTEADMQALEQQIQEGQNVSFGGNSYNIEDLLNDDTVSRIVSDYLMNPNSPESQKLAQTEPQLMSFIAKNQALFTDAVNQMQASTTEFGKIQEENKELANVGNTKIDDQLMSAFLEDFGQLRAGRYEIDPNSPLAYIKEDPKRGEVISTQLNSLIKSSPEYAQELAELSAQDLASLGIDKNAPKWRSFTDAVKVNQQLDQIADTDIDSALAAYFGMPVSPQKAQQFLSESKTRTALGIDTGMAGLLDSDGDGAVDSPEMLLANLRGQTPRPSLQDAVKGDVQRFEQGSLNQPPLKGDQVRLFDLLSGLADDGKVTLKELTGKYKDSKSGNPQTINDLQFILKQAADGKIPSINSDTLKGLQSMINMHTHTHTVNRMKEEGFTSLGSLEAKELRLKEMLNDPSISPGIINGMIRDAAEYKKGLARVAVAQQQLKADTGPKDRAELQKKIDATYQAAKGGGIRERTEQESIRNKLLEQFRASQAKTKQLEAATEPPRRLVWH